MKEQREGVPEISGCACGRDHMEMPRGAILHGEPTVELVCRKHKAHKPCRACRWEEERAISARVDSLIEQVEGR